jgi:hypothetical protein
MGVIGDLDNKSFSELLAKAWNNLKIRRENLRQSGKHTLRHPESFPTV